MRYSVSRLLVMGSAALMLTASIAFTAAAGQVTGGTATFDSVGQGGNPFERGAWGNARNGNAWAQYELPAPTLVRSIYIKSAGTDITSSGSVIDVKVKLSDGWHSVYKLKEQVINRGFSGGGRGPQTGPIRINLGNVEISGVRLDMSGNGWFAAEDVRLETP